MATTYNLKNNKDYTDFYNLVIQSIKDENNFKDGFPVDELGLDIDTDYLWDEFGHLLDGKQNGLGQQVFDEVLEYFRQ